MWQEHFSTTGKKSSLGQWYNVHHRYLGAKFSIKGKTHYGWVRLNVTLHSGGFDAVITGYAYETIPNKSIITGKTDGPADENTIDGPDAALTTPTAESATLGLLALGSRGLSIWRREDSVVAAPESN
jgi:hypothetical protein